jgi:protein OS-9
MIGQGKADKPKVMVGKIEVGGQKLVGGEGKKIERGRVVLTTEERAEIVMMQKDGQIQGLTKEELEKLDLNPEAIATFQKELQKLAGKKDWKIVRIDEPNGQIQLRGIVGSNAGKKLSGKEKTDDPPPNQDGNEGSEEEYYLEEI